MPACAAACSNARIGVMPEPAASSRSGVGVVGNSMSPKAGASDTTVPKAASRARKQLTSPPSIALTVIASRPSASTVGL
ncbi:hypothetical protein CKU38_02325 [Xanthomonas citri pv. fuscans]|nr:hypothetical protein CKU38_02325 [Xanthomonas citri pv. fuscans]